MTLRVYILGENMSFWLVYDNLKRIAPLYKYGEHVGFRLTGEDMKTHYIDMKRDYGQIRTWNVE